MWALPVNIWELLGSGILIMHLVGAPLSVHRAECPSQTLLQARTAAMADPEGLLQTGILNWFSYFGVFQEECKYANKGKECCT